RDFHVTGVQTCALPISRAVPRAARGAPGRQGGRRRARAWDRAVRDAPRLEGCPTLREGGWRRRGGVPRGARRRSRGGPAQPRRRSEERRGGEETMSGKE